MRSLWQRAVVFELRAFDPELEVIVVDDGSTDATAACAVEAGARVLRLPLNPGIGYMYASKGISTSPSRWTGTVSRTLANSGG